MSLVSESASWPEFFDRKRILRSEDTIYQKLLFCRVPHPVHRVVGLPRLLLAELHHPHRVQLESLAYDDVGEMVE
jgi:hypothetical protein